MYIAVEFDDDGSINDHATIRSSPSLSWEQVQGVFSPEHTVIYALDNKNKWRVKANDYYLYREET